MSKPPGPRQQPDRGDEASAFEAVRRIASAIVDLHDTDGRQSAVDGLITYSDGRVAALEVSSLGFEDEARIRAYLKVRGNRHEVAGLTRTWWVVVPRDFAPRDMPLVDAALRSCDVLGYSSLDESLALDDGEINSIVDRGVHGHVVTRGGVPAPLSPTYVYVEMPGGAVGSGLASLPDEMDQALKAPLMQRKISKLTESGLPERHLFLLVRPSAFTFPVYNGLAFGGALPTRPCLLPEGLDAVWLTTGLTAGGVVRGLADGAWRRDHPFVPADARPA